MRALAIAPLLVAIAALAFAADERSEEGGYSPSKALVELLEAEDDDGKPMIDPQRRAYFGELPSRTKELFESAIEYELMTSGEHIQAILALDLRPPDLELLMEDGCIICHSDPWQDAAALFSADPEADGVPSHMDLKEFTNDVHFRRGVSCAGCHGGDPLDTVMTDPTYESMPKAPGRHADRTWIPEFCARCHSDPAMMRRFDPDLPTDQYAKYRQSRHGRMLLQEGDSKAAQCVSCHGAHGIRGSRSPRSMVHAKNVASTCGACHADVEYMNGYLGSDGEPLPTRQVEDYRDSVHGRALFEDGDLGAPTCNDCHGNHAAMPPEVSSVAQICRTCHAGNGELFDGSSHKETFDRNGWPECGQCHDNHAIARADDSMLGEGPDSLCLDCHSRFAEDNEECQRTARYFHETITTLARGIGDLDAHIGHLAERGIDIDPVASASDRLQDILRTARSRIHAFDADEFAPVEKEGQATLATAWGLIDEAEAEYRFRRNGLFVSVGIMAFLALLLWLKIREIEARE